ncbi:MAG: hypothetical protein ACP5HG_14835 [Anaerolineae bacterium]
MVWTESTRAETRHVLEQIPPLERDAFADLFRDEDRYAGALDVDRYSAISDEAERVPRLNRLCCFSP